MKQPQEVVTQMFVATDQRSWQVVENCFASSVNLDYSSMTGQPASILKSNEITASWKTVLPGFEATHHQLGNFICTISNDTAKVFVYGTATHYLTDEKGNIWTVVGSYDFDLKQEEKHWKITAMRFNYKYQDGNTQLIKKAIENAQSK